MTDKREQDAAYEAFVSRLEPGFAGCDPRFIFDAGYRAALARPASGDAVEVGKVRDTPGLRASRESLGITQDEQRRRAMAAASRMKAEGTASKPGPATTEDPAQTEQGGERADLQGQKQSADTTATPPTSAQTEAMALADDAVEITERDKADFRQMVSEEPGLSGDPVWNVGYRLVAERRATLRQPASVEAEPVALLREAREVLHDAFLNLAVDFRKGALPSRIISLLARIDAPLADQVQS